VAAKKRRTKARKAPAGLSVDALRWRCDPKLLKFETTADVEPAVGVVGQDTAMAALEYGLQTDAPGMNVFVRGVSGTGRLTLVRRQIQQLRPTCPLVKDCCYVHNFGRPDQPRLITVRGGQGHAFRRRINRLIEFIRNELGEALNGESLKERRAALEETAEKQVAEIVEPFEAALSEAGLALVRLQAGPVMQTMLHPIVEGKPLPPEEFDRLHQQGQVSKEHYDSVRENYQKFEKQLEELAERVSELRRQLNEEVQSILEGAARWLLTEATSEINNEFADQAVQVFLGELVDDVVQYRLGELEKAHEFTELYRVNVLVDHKGDGACPIIVENAPTMRNLLGTIDYQISGGEDVRVSHLGIRAGSLLRADGGYLILEARDVLEEPGAWRALVRALRHRKLEIAAADVGYPWFGPSLKPEPIDLDVKVVLLGESDLYYLLDAYDEDFAQLFKVLADFDPLMPRDDAGIQRYAQIMSRIGRDEQLPPFDRSAVAQLVEHGARIAARRDRLTARFGRLADVAREASFIARQSQRSRVTGEDIRAAIERGRQRADLPSRRFREYLADGTIRVETQGTVVGQVNGLAVLQAGPLTYGFPCRISASIGPGTAGVINIERESALSGAIHTKGFYILGGLLRNLLQTDHPLAFDSSIAFEQSYGGIDGDSASGAEMCCLLSALTGVPLRQDLAMTGAIDQRGHILAIGAVNEKIEGFFDTCRDLGLTGTQGVIIPASNAGDLMLREDVVDACEQGQFHVHAVDRIHDALALFTGMEAGQPNDDGDYAPDSLLGIAVHRAREYWKKAAPRPPREAKKSLKSK
jgi:ATP-dependent Lon protease